MDIAWDVLNKIAIITTIIKQIIKNSVFFVILGIKRNLMAMLGVIGVILLNYALFVIFMPLGILLPFIITVAVCDFIGVYAAYPVILQYMLDEKDRKKVIYRLNNDEDTDEDYSDLNEEDNIIPEN